MYNSSTAAFFFHSKCLAPHFDLSCHFLNKINAKGTDRPSGHDPVVSMLSQLGRADSPNHPRPRSCFLFCLSLSVRSSYRCYLNNLESIQCHLWSAYAEALQSKLFRPFLHMRCLHNILFLQRARTCPRLQLLLAPLLCGHVLSLHQLLVIGLVTVY